MAGQELKAIWWMLSTIHNRPDDIKANVLIAAHALKQSGNTLPS
jgi:hypothetical protein